MRTNRFEGKVARGLKTSRVAWAAITIAPAAKSVRATGGAPLIAAYPAKVHPPGAAGRLGTEQSCGKTRRYAFAAWIDPNSRRLRPSFVLASDVQCPSNVGGHKSNAAVTSCWCQTYRRSERSPPVILFCSETEHRSENAMGGRGLLFNIHPYRRRANQHSGLNQALAVMIRWQVSASSLPKLASAEFP
jgi:hypothetical protein